MTTRSRPALASVGFFLLRVPALPRDTLDDLWLQVDGQTAATGRREANRDDQPTAARLRRLVSRPDVACALFLAAPDLFERAQAWLTPAGPPRRADEDIALPLLRYLLRMAGRATPHGLLAGTALGTIGEGCRLSIPPPLTQRWNVRVDPQWPHEAALGLVDHPDRRDDPDPRDARRDERRYELNPSLFRRGDRLRYCEPWRSGQSLRYRLSDVEDSVHLASCLEAASKPGGATEDEIVTALRQASPGVDAAAATGFVRSVAAAGLLLAAGSPAVTGPPGVRQLAQRLARHEPTRRLAGSIDAIADALAALDHQPVDDRLASLRDLDGRLRSLPVAAQPVRRLRADLRLADASPELPQAVIDEIGRHVETFARLGPPRSATPLSRFATAFRRRYRDQAVPLLEALDEESGIGFDGPGALADSATDPDSAADPDGTASRRGEDAVRWLESRTRHLLAKLVPALRSGAGEIVLSQDDLEAMVGATSEPAEDSPAGIPPRLPAGLDALVTIAAESTEAIAAGAWHVHLRRLIGPNCARLFGHLCHALPDLEPRLQQALRREEAAHPDVLHADVVHLPHGHAANSICRPVLRPFEIPVFAASGAPRDRQLALADLQVHVENGVVHLSSVRHRRRVMPHLSCAHAYGKSDLGLFRFLAAIEEQHSGSGLGFSWGGLDVSPFLPRLRHGRCILSLARWTVRGDTMLRHLSGSPDAALAGIRALRAGTGLPREVRLKEEDQALPIDLEHPLGMRLVKLACRRSPTLVFEEIFPSPVDMPVRCGASRFHHELVIPYVRTVPGGTAAVGASMARADPDIAPADQPEPIAAEPARTASALRLAGARPGSDWLYVIAEAGPVAIDRLLVERVWPLMDRLRAEGSIDRCFFIRYAVPDWQVRIRLHGEPKRLWRDAAPRLLATLADAGPDVTRTLIDTYFPECARYGGEDALALAHGIFEADSDYAVEVARACGGDTALRGQATVHGMHTLLDAFGLTLPSRESLLRRAVQGLAASVPVESASHAAGLASTGLVSTGPASTASAARHESRSDRARRFQACRDLIGLLRAGGGLAPLASLQAACEQRTDRIAPLADALRDWHERGLLERPLEAIIASCLHMWANRALRSHITAQEGAQYALLARAYRGVRSQAPAAREAVSG